MLPTIFYFNVIHTLFLWKEGEKNELLFLNIGDFGFLSNEQECRTPLFYGNFGLLMASQS